MQEDELPLITSTTSIIATYRGKLNIKFKNSLLENDKHQN